MTYKLLRIALIFFFTAACIGAVLRLFFFNPIPGSNYKYWLHAHSHVVLLGWVTNALLAALYFVLFQSRNQIKKNWIVAYGILQITVLGMLFTFPVQGYATYSIIFSTLHLVISYVFCFWVLRATKNESTVWHKFISYGIVYFMLSTLGPFSLGPIVSQGLAGSQWYFLAIYFYLHFLYNGFFTFAIFGLFFWWMDKVNINYSKAKAYQFFKLMNYACLPTYALSALWTKPPWYIYVIGFIGVVLLVLALISLIQTAKDILPLIGLKLSVVVKLLWVVAGLSFILKIALQFISVIPQVADLAYEVRNYSIGYLHLVFIGFVTCFILGWFVINRIIQFQRLQIGGVILFLAGFVASQLLIVGQPLVGYIPNYYQWLFGVSVLMAVGVLSFVFTKQTT